MIFISLGVLITLSKMDRANERAETGWTISFRFYPTRIQFPSGGRRTYSSNRTKWVGNPHSFVFSLAFCHLTTGTLSIDKQIVDSPVATPFLPPHKRPTVLQLQTGAVFPHLNVAKNIAYPLRQMTTESKIARVSLKKLSNDLNSLEIRNRLPSTLSGGQLSRVALARSLAGSPVFFYLMSPLLQST